MRDKKSKKSKWLKLMNSLKQGLTKNICMNFKKKLFHSDIANTIML